MMSVPTRERVHRRLPGGKALRDGHILYWWAEIIAIVVFYVVYSGVRNADVNRAREALHNAKQLISLEQALGIFHEQTLNRWAIDFTPLAVFGNYFYGSMHFVVTIGVAIYLFRKWPDDWPLWRNTLAIATALALIGFRFWPLMPPRLLPPGLDHGFVDTLDGYPTLWTFNSGAMKNLSNQYAAMPSVHCCWALWCACALVPRLRRPWAKALAVFYPVMTVIVIVLTANHYLLDAPAGFFILGVGYLLARMFTRAGRGTPVDPPPESTDPDVGVVART